MAEKSIPNCNPGVYATLLPVLIPVARRHGYSLAVHGSMLRDFDLIAVPWTSTAKPAWRLAEAMRRKVRGFWKENDTNGSRSAKPHGRRCWSIHLGGGGYIDLSVMPRLIEDRLEERMMDLAAHFRKTGREDASRELVAALYGGADLPRRVA